MIALSLLVHDISRKKNLFHLRIAHWTLNGFHIGGCAICIPYGRIISHWTLARNSYVFFSLQNNVLHRNGIWLRVYVFSCIFSPLIRALLFTWQTTNLFVTVLIMNFILQMTNYNTKKYTKEQTHLLRSLQSLIIAT